MKNSLKDYKEERFILSIDGGGIRGIIPAYHLQRMAEMLHSWGDKIPFYAHFDLIAGTSTGGLQALALSSPVEETGLLAEDIEPYPVIHPYRRSFLDWMKGEPATRTWGTLIPGADPSQLLGLYLESANRIFPQNKKSSISQVFSDKYDSRHLRSFLGTIFKKAAVSDSVVPVLVIAYDSASAHSVLISSSHHQGFLMHEAATATSAAPTYFSPLTITNKSTRKRQTLIDGGVIANNPALYAYAEAKRLYPNARKYHILSLSTGSGRFIFDASNSGGMMSWVDPIKGLPIYRIYASSQMTAVDDIAPFIPDLEYVRIHKASKGESIKMDDIAPESLAALKKLAENTFAAQEKEITSFLKKASTRTTFDQVRRTGVLTGAGQSEQSPVLLP
ncbi:patatin-like phospholipase family protein [Parasphaerochaeta coccoides]|nr:patatin-like phospholipase family protein [Parasphaerochaeta coccoides]